MPQLAFRLFAVTALSVLLSACVVDPALMGTAPTAPVVPAAPAVKTDDLPDGATLIEGVYSAKADPQFNVPAVPVEKVPTQFQRQTVEYASDQPVGTIIISPGSKQLYLITGRNKAVRYGIAVGKAGFQWSGEALITGRKTWPTWTPPKEMIARKPDLAKYAEGQPGGLSNPLGARALYLTTNGVDYGYRIHGTPDWWSIGKNASSGCIRMVQQDVIDLNQRVTPGATVLVLNADGSLPKSLKIPTPPKPKQSLPTPVDKVDPALAPMPEIRSVGYEPRVVEAAPAALPAPAAPMVVAPAAPTATP